MFKLRVVRSQEPEDGVCVCMFSFTLYHLGCERKPIRLYTQRTGIKVTAWLN